MPMSACCPRNKAAAGFTLIEILTVLVIAGMLVALVAPGLQRMMRSSERASQREALTGEIAELAYRAWVEGKAYTLGGEDTSTTYKLHLPKDWRVEIAKPIRYAFNGVCGGGELTLLGPGGWREKFSLAGPRCDRLIPADR